MSPAFAFVLLLTAFIAWTLLPFLPAILELVRPRDASPLVGVGADSGELTWFADGFRRYANAVGLVSELDHRYGEPLGPGMLTSGRFEPLTVFELRDRTTVRVLRSVNAARELATIPGKPRIGDRPPDDLLDIIVIDVDTQLPDKLAVDRELYARSDFIGGAGMRVRAMLAARNADLAIDSVVVRWIHADGRLLVGRGSALFGRATSSTEMRLAPNVRFERVMAPRIIVGDEDDEFVPPPTADLLHGEPWARPMTDRITQMCADTLRVRGDLVVPSGAIVSGNLVVLGALVLERGAQLHGSAKAHKGIQLVGENIVTKSLTAREDLHVGERSRVAGPLIGERTVYVHANVFVGTPHARTTVTAPTIVLSRGVTVFGAVAARENGITE
jgi:predicted acyltransferase (DUF342 family)